MATVLQPDTPSLHHVSCNGLDLAVWEWPGDDPALVFAHATGLHGRIWDRIARCFPERHRLCVEFRGHGRSAKPSPPYRWRDFGRDLAALAEHFNLRGSLGIGHSMGGHALVSSVALRPASFSGLLLIDPTIFPPEYYGRSLTDSSYVLRRRNQWTSSAEMFERFRNRPPFVTWHPEILRDYCEFGIVPEGDGFVLACPPAVEASIYSQSTNPDNDLYAEIPRISQPVTVLRAAVLGTPEAFTLASSPTPPDLASKFPRGRDVHQKDVGHFIPMEWPDGVVALISEMLSEVISEML